MNFYSNKKALIESALMASITSLFVVSTLYIPALSILLMLLPVPFIILSVRHGTRYTILSFIIVSLLIGFLTGILYTAFVFIVFGPISVVMGYYTKRKKQPYEVIGLGTAASVLSIFFILQLISIISGIHIIDEIALMITAALDHQVEMLKTVNLDPVDVKEALNYMMMILPALIIIQSMIGTFINYYLATLAINRFKLMDQRLSEFSDFKLPNNIVLGSFIIFVLSLSTRYIEGIQHISLIANVTIIFSVLFFLQGITFIGYLLKRTKLPKAIRFIILALLILVSPLMTLVSLLGLLDTVIDLRRGKKKE
ncbi:YybS family protein [Natronincola ferrireducens]|uniref:Uncharacterized conserved protein YybS, DUF2232 family n=1 Tax=Natronincola ferrireducens TaxID=393762 RepID=A0A1G9HNR5_9FIRM|nr:YybS family protein [Natronincola ferrireducens]SDL14637.1 Uncharacterized conserved protein YybS, DUF2232 family [Natronincola ferrireducens]